MNKVIIYFYKTIELIHTNAIKCHRINQGKIQKKKKWWNELKESANLNDSIEIYCAQFVNIIFLSANRQFRYGFHSFQFQKNLFNIHPLIKLLRLFYCLLDQFMLSYMFIYLQYFLFVQTK